MKYDEYKKYLDEGIDITKDFDLSNINENSIIMRHVLTSDKDKSKDGEKNLYLTYNFIYDDSYCLIILLNKTPKGFFVLPDYWFDDIDELYYGNPEKDIKYIQNSKRHIILQFSYTWFNEYANSKKSCEHERKSMMPHIRKNKIKKILK